MCLTICTTTHPPADDYRSNTVFARVAATDILVWKLLKKKSFWSWKWFAPYRDDIRWFFGKLVHERSMTSEVRRSRGYRAFQISEGLHAFYRVSGASERIASWGTAGKRAGMFPAIIPAGSTFWVGRDEEIVADNLILFRSHRDATKGRSYVEFRSASDALSHRLVSD